MQTHDEGGRWEDDGVDGVSMRHNQAAMPQPAPQHGMTEVTPLVIEDVQARREMGIRKYGTPLMVENGRDHLMDAYQEILDLAVYMRCEVEQRRALWQAISGIYATALILENHDHVLLAPLVSQIRSLWEKRMES